MTSLREMQTSLPWTTHYHRDFRASPMTHKDFAHALTHVFKAGGKLAALVNDAEHGGCEFTAEDVDNYVADLVVCALRMANTVPGRTLDLEAAVLRRIAEKNRSRAEQPEEAGVDAVAIEDACNAIANVAMLGMTGASVNPVGVFFKAPDTLLVIMRKPSAPTGAPALDAQLSLASKVQEAVTRAAPMMKIEMSWIRTEPVEPTASSRSYALKDERDMEIDAAEAVLREAGVKGWTWEKKRFPLAKLVVEPTEELRQGSNFATLADEAQAAAPSWVLSIELGA